MWDLPGPGIELVSPAWAGRFFTTGHQGSPGHLFIFAGESASDTTERLHFSLSCIGGGNGNPLQCSCVENPRDGGAWWAAQSRT